MNVAGDGSDRDEYARRARYLPGLLMLAPVGIVVAAAGWQDARMVTVIVGAAVTIGLPVVLESFVRQQGLAFDVTELAGSDGRWVTTQMMWPLADTDAETVRNVENRRVVEAVIGRRLPAEVPRPGRGGCRDARRRDRRDPLDHEGCLDVSDPQGGERRVRHVAESARGTCVRSMDRRRVRRRIARIDRREAHPIVSRPARPNWSSGCWRSSRSRAFWWVVPTDRRIRQAAQRYALALFDAARLLTCDPKLTPHDPRQERP